MALVGGQQWLLSEKENINLWLSQEKDELVYPAKNDLEWLNQHIAEIFESGTVSLQDHLKTPANIKRVPLGQVIASQKKPIDRVAAWEPEDDWIHPLGESKAVTAPPVRQEISQEEVNKSQDTSEEEDVQRLTPEPTSPEPATRAASEGFSPRSEIVITDDEFDVDLRAPELIAHEERMAAELTPSPSKSKFQSILSSAKKLMTRSAGISAAAKIEAKDVASPTPTPAINTENMPGMFPSIDTQDEKTSTTRTSINKQNQDDYDEENYKQEEDKAIQRMNEELERARMKGKARADDSLPATTQTSKPIVSTKTNIGRPIRPSRIMAQPKPQLAKPRPVSIKVGIPSQRPPINTAPVAAHNQDIGPPPVIGRKVSVLSMAPMSQSAKPKSILLAEKKKAADEARAKEAALRKQQQEKRRLEHAAEAQRKKDLEVAKEIELDRSARQHSDDSLEEQIERREAAIQGFRKSEERQERELRAQQPPPRPVARLDFHPDSPERGVPHNPLASSPAIVDDSRARAAAALREREEYLNQYVQFPEANNSNVVNTGDIQLPACNTDSDSNGSDDEWEVPDWATPGHLEAQLLRQAHIDPVPIFGRPATFKLEETFNRLDPARLARLRNRTSSAAWVPTGDRLTRRSELFDNIARNIIAEQGGWSMAAVPPLQERKRRADDMNVRPSKKGRINEDD